MTMTNRLVFASTLLAGLSLSLSAFSAGSCPAELKDAANKAQPGSKVVSCKQETEHGKVQYEVKLKTTDGKGIELDVSPGGAILQTEEKIPGAPSRRSPFPLSSRLLSS